MTALEVSPILSQLTHAPARELHVCPIGATDGYSLKLPRRCHLHSRLPALQAPLPRIEFMLLRALSCFPQSLNPIQIP